jgi:hypothetical protein
MASLVVLVVATLLLFEDGANASADPAMLAMRVAEITAFMVVLLLLLQYFLILGEKILPHRKTMRVTQKQAGCSFCVF